MKNIKSVIINYSLIAFSCGLITACGSEERKDIQTNQESASQTVVDTASSGQLDEMVEFKFHYLVANIPSPMAMVDVLPGVGANYRSDLLLAPGSEDKYLSSMKKAFAFGVFSTDLAYITGHEQYVSIQKYLGGTRNLAKALDLSETFDKVAGQRLQQNLENKDSIRTIIDQAYYEVDNYMRTNERALTATQVLTGSWVESQYITLQLAKTITRNPKTQILFDKIFEQKKHLSSLVSLLKEYENQKDFAPYINKLRELEKDYASMKTTDLDNPAFLSGLADKLTSLRAEVVK
jgi:hypothetical protein